MTLFKVHVYGQDPMFYIIRSSNLSVAVRKLFSLFGNNIIKYDIV